MERLAHKLEVLLEARTKLRVGTHLMSEARTLSGEDWSPELRSNISKLFDAIYDWERSLNRSINERMDKIEG